MKITKNEKAVAEIRRIIETYAHGCSNPEAVERINRAAFLTSGLSLDASEKLSKIKHWAPILYSSRKHRQWDLPAVSGAERIIGFIFGDLSTLESLVCGGVSPTY